jgi:molybdopterin biosynthesis enzyme
VTFAPDDADLIRQAIAAHIENGCDLILLSGGMSVDPDDVTRICDPAGGRDRDELRLIGVLPGAMFLAAWIGDVPLLGVPACGLYHRTTVLDLVLPRILAGERIGKKELAFSATAVCARTAGRACSRTAPSAKGLDANPS